ncbi:MAG: TonB-dependent receptor, partial [Bacteroidota bacterium]
MKRKLYWMLALLGLATGSVWGQGVTTASLSGTVSDNQGELLPGATVVAIHGPTGARYGAVTNVEGRYNLQGLRIGGPYTLEISFVGYNSDTRKGLYLQLGVRQNLDATLAPSTTQLSEVEIVANGAEDRTGASTSLSEEVLTQLPTIARSAQDFTRLTPQADGISFGGRNNLYNNFSLDGSIFNNSFGLDVATPGGQTDAQPVSLDAIEQITVTLAPFDVRQSGFTGAGVNAVTRSGSNTIQGSAYYFFRNNSLAGQSVAGEEAPNLQFGTSQTGFRIGGPIIKNKVFFFLNAEAERRDQLAHGFVAEGSATEGAETNVDVNELDAVRQHLLDNYGWDPGRYEGYNHQTLNNKIIAKIDWNINENHDFVARFNFLDSWKDILPNPEAIGGRGPTPFRLPFENSSYRIHNDIFSYVGELNSRWDNATNRVLVGYTAFRDFREPWSTLRSDGFFPTIDIWDNFNGVTHITAGSEMFSTGNVLNQDVFQFTNDFTYFVGDHSLMAGVNYENFRFENSFNLFFYPWVVYGSVDDFLNDSPLFSVGTGPTEDASDLNALVAARSGNEFSLVVPNVGLLGVYLQDEWQVSDQLNLTLGFRMDVPIYRTEIAADPVVQSYDGWRDENGNSVSFDPSVLPDPVPLFSPRIGFNYDVKGDRSFVLRGGTGIFTGRIPFVWLGNQASNAFLNEGFNTFQVNATAEDFRFPQVWKTNLAADVVIGNGWNLTGEVIYGKDVNAIVHRNYTMAAPTATLSGSGDTRPIFQGNEANTYNNPDFPNSGIDAGAIVLDNTDQGYQLSATASLSKTFDFGLTANIAYSYLDSRDLTSIPAEIAADAFQRNPVVGNPNLPQFSWSRYGLQHRIVGGASYRRVYAGGKLATSLGAFYEIGQGRRYSYVYAGDLNRDNSGANNNDLLYVPMNAGDINFGTVDDDGNAVEATDAAAQWQALDAFINQDPYLSTRRGDYAERNGATLPWFAQMDIKLLQDVILGNGNTQHRFQVSLDILNVGNQITDAPAVADQVA